MCSAGAPSLMVSDDPMVASNQTADEVAVVDALRSAVSSSAGVATRPGLLRVRLESALDPEGDRFTAVAHQVVAAAKENLPSVLAGLAPITAESIDRVTAQLASARGWSESTALRTVLIWADALGLERPTNITVPTAPTTFAGGVDSAGLENVAGITMVPQPASPRSGTGEAEVRAPLRVMASVAGDAPTSLPDPDLTNVAPEQADPADNSAEATTGQNAKRRSFRRRG
jgi:hypothetical protein